MSRHHRRLSSTRPSSRRDRLVIRHTRIPDSDSWLIASSAPGTDEIPVRSTAVRNERSNESAAASARPSPSGNRPRNTSTAA